MFSHLRNGAGDLLRPLGLDSGGGGAGARLAVSPRSERAYSHISREFDVLFQALQADAEAPRAAAARPCGGAGGRGAACSPTSALLQLPPAGAGHLALCRAARQATALPAWAGEHAIGSAQGILCEEQRISVAMQSPLVPFLPHLR